MVKDQIRLLRKIQHLLLIRDEHENVGSGERTEALAAEIARLQAQLEPEAAALYRRLVAKSRLFLSPLSRGNCSACGMRVPTARLQHVLGEDQYVPCTNCGRILYRPDVKATGLRPGEPDPKFPLSRYSTGKLMVPTLKAETPEGAIAELCDVLAKEKMIAAPEAVVTAALEREKILSTAVGNGLAFPHMRGVEEGVLTFAAGVSPKGIDWNGQTVNLVVFTVLPVVASPFYLKLLGAFAKTFADGEKMPFILSATDAKTLWKELNKAMRVAIKNMQG